MQLFRVILLSTAVSAANIKERTGSGGCNRDNCLRAVQGTAKGPAQVQIARTDCSSFLQVTTTVPSRTATVTHTATVTAPAVLPKRNNAAKTVPTYASACSGAARYSSACSCWGITAGTKTITSGVTTKTVKTTVTVPAKSSCTVAPKTDKCGDKCVDLKSDPKNCGACGVSCSSGTCTNGVCAATTCTNLGTCDNFSTCGAGGACVCASTSDNTGFCVSGDTPCAGLADCQTSADCALGSVCAVGSCCTRNVCIAADACGGSNLPKFLFARVSYDTVGHRGS
ncbi:hypothetical protein ONS95_005110 [Cadophora gregata]|uniref:uncharacterized protein n=1 Tax=Cadophora gregata TaxID=51156 RepID=UPI0026DA9848|nr:uncharacterized protein ONS95_005110 [Cadophora gregata]KAK0104844.1 hypothetical protein ONS95_005110 [Cadophora gregata]KAK0115075.1 hypothetical protein ONS96_013545 [Cadophora gregata f. sp. sojae]